MKNHIKKNASDVSYRGFFQLRIVREKGLPQLMAENIKVLLGDHNISDKNYLCRRKVNIFKIFIHLGWDSDDLTNRNHNIALLEFVANSIIRVVFNNEKSVACAETCCSLLSTF